MAKPANPNDAGPPPAPPPPEIAGHQLLRRIGEGTYGEVWLARNSLGTYRAVKMVHRARFAGGHEQAYEREFKGIKLFEPVSREHPGLVDILQVGRDDKAGFYYYVMELADDGSGERIDRVMDSGIDGGTPADHQSTTATIHHSASYTPRTLSSELQRQGRLPCGECLKIALALAAALDHLHRHKLVHRDIKPANIIFAGGESKLADPGLVSELGAAHTSLGTAGFSPPEGPGTAQGDIYSLGKVIYEAATGKDRQEFPELPTQLEAAPEAAEFLALNDIILKACERDPAARYQSATEMLDELRLLERGESVRRVRWRKRLARRLTIGAGAVVLFAGLLVLLRDQLRVPANEQLPRGDAPEILVDEQFGGGSLNPTLWTYGITNKFADPEYPGTSDSFITQSNGEARIVSRVRHQGGWTRREFAWLEFQQDLRTVGRCRIEIKLSGTTTNGRLYAAFTDGTPPSLGEVVTNEVIVWKLDGSLPAPAQQPPQTVSIDLVPESQIAAVREAGNALSIEDVFNLWELRAWRLRFRVATGSSAGFGLGSGELNLDSVRVVRLPPTPELIGKVVNTLTGSPIEGAEVRDRARAAGEPLALTKTSGTFFIANLGTTTELIAVKNGWLHAAVVPGSIPNGGLLKLLGLRKENYEYGDVVAVVPCAPARMGGLEFRAGELWAMGVYLATNVNESRLFRLDTAQTGFVPVGKPLPWEQLSALAATANRFWGFKWYRGFGFNLESKEHNTGIRLLHTNGEPLDWPMDAAFDGQWLWVVNRDLLRSNVCLCALNPDTLEPVLDLPSRNLFLRGLAWDEKQFWTSGEDGQVFPVNRELALQGKLLEAGRLAQRRIPGHYGALTFDGDYLWGLAEGGTNVHKIKIRD